MGQSFVPLSRHAHLLRTVHRRIDLDRMQVRRCGHGAEEIADEHQRVRGVIIALEDDLRIKRALKVAPNIEFYRYEVKFDLIKS